jgi:hypothetical protein
MDYQQEQTKYRLEVFQRGTDGPGFSVSIKLRVPDCFCREHHAPVANRLIDDYRMCHPLDPTQCEYVEHESGPELLLHLAVVAGKLGLATAALTLVKSVIELVTAMVKARYEGRRKGDAQHGPLVIIVQGIDPDGAFYEKQVLEVDPHTSPSPKAIETSLTDTIQLIAEERARQERKGSDSLP